ncbi:conserved hypothetical protein [Leishmania mexicana MHOM/GT/2001/U1103]|uniref:Uncharacterized protein n=1 Tax=Leishmania mexicana (strain MHOM/GT/2001/U1103) TaxID=929439 RepID=E9AY91_LEIMU|nr:conserved hypothetical protein [Leishmania mexicana MHOM/GT/2001/U1103]CBZ27932.1 conserved hypothetical protein [Leishmania mexicana MHOM/GT/2001/U1103]
MAVPEGRSIYEVLGTVLYRTIPVNMDDANVQRQQQRDDFDVPLDYDTALALREIDDAAMAARYLATKARGAAPATAGGAASHDGSVVADRVSSATATRVSVAATSKAPVPPQRSSTPPFTSVRHGGSGSGGGQLSAAKTLQCALRGGSSSENPLVTNFRSSLEVAGGQWKASEAVDIGAQNAHLVRARINAAAVKAAGSGTGVVSVAGRLTRDDISARTVAQAMEILFPLEAAGHGGGSRAESANDGEERASDGTPTPPFSASTSRVLSAATVAAARSATHAPVMWRRADVAHLSRLDVILLYRHLQHRCARESARPRGVVCPNRECIYNDGLRELIRQVTLLCPERGLLLDELARSMRQAIETYDVLLDSANQYAVRKSTERDLHQHLFAEKTDLETEVRRREHRVNEWRAKYAGLQKRFQEQQEADRKLHAEEIAYAKRANQQLVSEIKRLASEAGKAKGA